MLKICAKTRRELFHLYRSEKPYSYPSSCACYVRVFAPINQSESTNHVWQCDCDYDCSCRSYGVSERVISGKLAFALSRLADCGTQDVLFGLGLFEFQKMDGRNRNVVIENHQ